MKLLPESFWICAMKVSTLVTFLLWISCASTMLCSWVMIYSIARLTQQSWYLGCQSLLSTFHKTTR